MRLDDQLVIRMNSEMRTAIKEAAAGAQISEGAVVRWAVERAEKEGLLVPYWFAYIYHKRDQKQESAE